jgi:23S rRNA (uracil1939-C5)-methyltransferase
MSYESQLNYKQNMVKNNIMRIGGISDFEMCSIIGMEEPFYFRNKAQFPVGQDKYGNLVMGFYAAHSHSIIDNLDCCIGSPINAGILAKIKEFMLKNHIQPYNESQHTGLVRHVLIRIGASTGEVMVCLVINGTSIPVSDELVKSLSEVEGIASIMLNINKENTNVILGKKVKTLWGKPYIEDYIGNVKYQISPLSFFQVNPKQTEKLYRKALAYADLRGDETVWDLYCGIGTISLFLAQKAKKVYGVEIVPEAIDDAKNNARINGIENAEFFVGKAEEILPAYYAQHQDEYADVIVVDPPRKGCYEELLKTIVEMSPAKVVYVSCDSATLARDLKYMTENGYQVVKVQPVDQFGHSVHVETVTLLLKVDK